MWRRAPDASRSAIANSASLFAQLVSRIEFSPDGQLLAASEGSAGVGVWKVGTGEFVRSLAGGFGFIFAGNGQLAALSIDGAKVVLYDLLRGREQANHAPSISPGLPPAE